MTPDRQDVGAFLARLNRLDAAALVRLRRVAPDRTALWGRLPWAVLVSRTVAGAGPDDATVAAADLLKAVDLPGDLVLPARRDAEWRWPLPPAAGRVVEQLPAAEVRRIAAAAAGTLRAAATEGVGGRPVAERAVRDALLDHVAIVVTTDGAHIEVPQRLVQGVARMGFLGRSDMTPAGTVNVQLAGRWIGLAAPYGIAWLLPVSQFAVRPATTRTNG
ncbi:hypothetical protein [Phytohabitans aurantiacus]|jgi:hypothetical protein|uniref:Uncharacterized protein n=1 Tax=Phytohabitans aurantiacus TaxID=3016789 RepID=A0ABQ5RCY3_9ACTN|nr:hypothetical protein [Phytohabitans aurantiacus]GLI03471.1 hypothetical protein Pa4123_87490 [Phytohabitans aurantiacus]